jgi:RNA polymerase sigma-70 factor (ECF subfamily)
MNTEIHMKLVKSLKSGSYEDFNKLYTIYADMLYNFILGLTKSPTEAEDIVQDTFLRIWQSRERINPNLSFKTYLYTIARNQTINVLRKQVDNVAFEEYIRSKAFQEHSENDVEKNISFDEFKEKLSRVKEKLTPRQKLVFEMSREKGYSIPMIAEELQLSEKTIKNQLTLALKILREELAYCSIFLFLLF